MNIPDIKLKQNLCAAVLFLVCYIAALLLADAGLAWAGAVLLAFIALAGYAFLAYGRRSFADAGALLVLSWNAGLSLAILRLSQYHTPWTIQSKICFGIFVPLYLLGEAIPVPITKKSKKKSFSLDALYVLIGCVCAVSCLCFLAEAVILGYIPIFSTETHAYNYFHISGVHYFTVSCMMTHALTAVYLIEAQRPDVQLSIKKKVGLVIFNMLSLSVAVMCVSKFQLFLDVALPALIYFQRKPVQSFRKLPWKRIALGVFLSAAFLAAMFWAFTRLRHYEPGYLDSVFSFRNSDTPEMVQYIYMYIANNYANFNCLTEGLEEFSHGLKQLFPLFALTGLKFVCPVLVNFPAYVVKEEINTLTLIYDAYYDFGIAGVAGFGLLLGAVGGWLRAFFSSGDNPVTALFYAQFALYAALSFFSAWYSVATTWFWFALTAVFGAVVMKKEALDE